MNFGQSNIEATKRANRRHDRKNVVLVVVLVLIGAAIIYFNLLP